MTQAGAHTDAIWQIVHRATRARRQDLLADFMAQHGKRVQTGPFAGTVLSDRAAWGDGDLLPKLLGCYECELHAAIEEMIASGPDLVFNIGAAEGYYAIGMARRLGGAFVHAFETDPAAQDICRETARLNGVGDRVSVAGQCTPGLLQALLARGRAPAVICDCEGDEKNLIDPQRVPALKSARLIVECHDFLDPSITQTLVARLEATHALIGVREGARDPNASVFLQAHNSLDRWLAVCEYRPAMMHWLIATPK